MKLSALVGFCILALTQGVALSGGRPAYICEVLFDNFCPTNAATCANDPVLHFGSSAYSLSNFNVISFGDFNGPSGDIQGRAAVRNNAYLNAYSFGYELQTSGVAANSPSYPYSIVVGGDAHWHGGATYPDGSGFPHAGNKEYIFVGSDFSDADSYLQVDRTGSCPTAGCLNADFDAAQAYYEDLSAAFATLPNNANINVQPWGTIDMSCNSLADAQYVITISPDVFSTLTSWNVDSSCNAQSGLIVNIVGSGSQVKFAGATQDYFDNAKTLYNVVPTGSTTPSVRVEVGVNGNLLAPDSNYNQPGMGVFIGQVIVANIQQTLQINFVYCNPPPSNNHNNSNSYLCPAWELDCEGLDFTQASGTYSFRDYNAISFGDFTADTGDIQGRLAVQNNCQFGNGYSIGYELQTATGTPDRHVDWALVCGGDATWGSGSLHPDGSGIPFPGLQENIFVGGVFTSNQSDLVDRVTGGPCGESSGCLNSEFDDARSCYETYSANMAATPDNVAFNIEWSGLSITCNDASATDYTISLTPEDFSSFTYTTTGNCNFQARWVINIRGNGDIEITGASFPGVPGGIVYNVVGCERTVYIHDTTLNGGLLAACSTVNQPEGLIQGKVVAGNIVASRQINLQNTCPQQITVTVPVVTQVPSINSQFAQFTNDFLVVGDNLDGAVVTDAKGDNTYEFNKLVNFGDHQVIYFDTSSTNSRTPNEITADPSSASVVSMTVAFVVALIALAF